MVWGAIGGTIPDLDIVANLFMSEVDALAAHRGLSHSITFAVLGSAVFGWMIFQMYKSPYYKWMALGCRTAFVGGLLGYFVYNTLSNGHYLLAALAIPIAWLMYIWHKRRYFSGELFESTVNLKEWVLMMFMALFTHALLDCFTMYGTQIFAPFSDYRVAFSSVAVADPAYTLPFAICLIVAAFYKKNDITRRKWNYAGLIISSLYLVFTVWNKQHINGVYEAQLAKQNINYNRCLTGPSILNNILWNSTVESDTSYYQGQYSLFDHSDIIFTPIPKNHQMLENSENDRTLKILKWFTKDFYNVIIRKDGRLQLNDLRFGTFRGYGDGENDFIFRFILEKEPDGQYKMISSEGGPPQGSEQDMLRYLWQRIKGR
jgi:inner membrane protein